MGHKHKKHSSSKGQSSKGHSSKHEGRKDGSSKREQEPAHYPPLYHLTHDGTSKLPPRLRDAKCAAIWVESFWTGSDPDWTGNDDAGTVPDPSLTANHIQFKMIFESPWGLYRAACVSLNVGVPYNEDPEDTMEQGSLSLVPGPDAGPSAGSTQTLEITQRMGEDGQDRKPTLSELLNPIFEQEIQYFSFDTRNPGVRDVKHWM